MKDRLWQHRLELLLLNPRQEIESQTGDIQQVKRLVPFAGAKQPQAKTFSRDGIREEEQHCPAYTEGAGEPGASRADRRETGEGMSKIGWPLGGAAGMVGVELREPLQ